MAFHQPTRQSYQRLSRPETSEREPQAQAPSIRLGNDESQTWVLFSPATDAVTTTSYLSSVDGSQPTPGRSVLSDLGSLNTIARSDRNSAAQNSAGPPQSIVEVESVVEDDAELDSLDSHLADFRSLPSPYRNQGVAHATPVLPGHDGLGSFRLDNNQGMIGSELQEQLYAFERFNPKRVKRRRESLDLAQLEMEQQESSQEAEKNRRIEAWRLEQSQFLLDKIRKETRQRRQSEASIQKLRSDRNAADELATLGAMGEAAHETQFNGDDWHDQDASGSLALEDGLWSRITRKVIRDLMGIDDHLLSILFGEALTDELPGEDDLSSTPKASAIPPTATPAARELESHDDSTWQLRILERVARELGLLVHRMSTHPGAFSTYVRMQQAPIPYAGLPVIPEAAIDANEAGAKMAEESIPLMPEFKPTLAHQTRPVSIPGAQSPSSPETMPSLMGETGSSGPAFTQPEWEQDLDIRLVFRYLRSRFTSNRSSSTPFTSGTSHLATSSTQDAAAKAARVRQHHPLVSHSHPHQRARPVERRPFKAVASPSSPAALRHHAPGSCASQSTRRSARRSSVSSRHSSRHYWDIGGSIGTGSMIASTGPMGSWGEV
ncbi:hypothetical protein QBC33DRAFT_218129 [Phialemonium atrogriseum]|uniref:Uncharacterized protein n=1 Tax=Phialemonium atrogriseum TaxID=1093897 RepID=A0AAJ0FS52_9PEZI|nr:uncharacterized protein QBC33DRAFT_218129 [Phialemonium atrogriseum]KAK1770820.1 hypothetical protein QBC33DRAFT_218129 [Phialemonium atrogriseum]